MSGHRPRPVAADIAADVRRAGLTHEAVASFLDRDRSLITKQFNGQSPIDVDDFERLMDLTDSIRPVQKMMLRMGYEVVPLGRVKPVSRLRAGYYDLMRDVGAACSEVECDLEDGTLDDPEAAISRLERLIEHLHALRAGIPSPPERPARTRRSRG